MHERRFRRLYRLLSRPALPAVVLMLVAAGCGDATTGSQPEPTATATSTETPTLAPTATGTPTPLPPATATEEPAGPATQPPQPTGRQGPSTDIAPPLAVLTAGAGTQEAKLGTYCWQDDEQGLCADYAGLPVPETPLVVEQGERITINVPGINQLVNVLVEVYDYADTDLDGDTPMIFYPPPQTVSVPYEDDGDSVTVTAELPAGRYVISLFVGFPSESPAVPTPNAGSGTVRGDAMYGFTIEVAEGSS